MSPGVRWHNGSLSRRHLQDCLGGGGGGGGGRDAVIIYIVPGGGVRLPSVGCTVKEWNSI